MSDPDMQAAEAAAIARVRAGDPAAYAVLVRAHAGVATRLAYLSGAGSEAEDVVQEAFLKAYAGLADFREGAAFRPWLLRIVLNESRNRHRSRERRLRRDDHATRGVERITHAPGPAEQAELSDRQRQLRAAVQALPAGYREVVTCRYLMELTESETALVLDLAIGTAKSRLYRALRALRAEVGDV